MLGALVRRFGDFDDAEDAVQEALLAASLHWPREGVPASPRGWLLQTAERRLIDAWRSEGSRRRREELVAREPTRGAATARDDTLSLLFMCCHPALTPASAIALTLRAVGGLTTAEIARAFLVGEATMAQRITRAKQRIEESGMPFRLPERDEQAARLPAVLHVLDPVFNEGYAASGGEQVHRAELSREAIRLARLVHGLLPDDPEATGLLALMLLDRRAAARASGRHRRYRLLGEQDRTLWDRGLVAEGAALVERAFAQGAVARTSSRRRSQPSTTGRGPPMRPTGARSSRSTGSSSR